MMNKHILTVMVALALIIGYNTIIVSNYAVASKSPYRSGYDHGASDARDDCSDGCDWYPLYSYKTKRNRKII
jgi:hypothetical protein